MDRDLGWMVFWTKGWARRIESPCLISVSEGLGHLGLDQGWGY